jgi:DNA-binding cell septation regulator SpoVG
VKSYLRKLQGNGEIKSFEWVSRDDAYSPHDFLISKNNTDIFIEVKSTRGNFESEIHISLNQLKEMSYDTKTYHIYRIFNIDELSKTAKLRIAEDVKDFAKEILKVFKSLEALKVDVDSISVLPSNLNFQEEIKEIELLDE